MDENKKKEANHDVSIALIQKDISYIRESITKIDTTIALFNQHFARKDEMTSLEKVMEKMNVEFAEALNKKVDKDNFEPIKKTLQKINWMMISAFIVAILSLVIKANE